MKKTRITALAGALSLAAALTLTVAGSAFAVTDPGPAGTGACAALKPATVPTASAAPSPRTAGIVLTALKAFGNCEIERRYTTLADLSSKISGSKVLTSSDAAALNTIVANTKSGLASLQTKLNSETTVAAAKTDVIDIAVNYRVYLLVAPQVHLVSAADGVLALQTKFATINTTLSARIAAEKAAGRDVTAAQADLNAMNASVTAAINLASPVPAALLPLTPAQYNAGPGATALTNARAALVQARADLKSAVASAQACRAALK